MEDIISWLKLTGKVAIHDATNSTVGRRKVLLERLALAGAEMNIQ